MANMNIKSSECAWHQTEVKVLGRTLTGIRGWEIKKTVEKEHLYGAVPPGGMPGTTGFKLSFRQIYKHDTRRK